MVLDDCLNAIREMRRNFRLPAPTFGLQDMESHPRVKQAVTEFIESTVKKHDLGILARLDLFPPKPGWKVFEDEPVGDPNYPRHRFLPDCAGEALRRTLEEAFQTIAQLPPEFPKPAIVARDIISLMSHLNKCADKVEMIRQQWPAMDGSLREVLDFADLGRLAERLKGEGKTLEQALLSASTMKTVRINPKPQVSLILYLADWIEVGTDRKRYAFLDMLAEAAFEAAGKQPPKWIGRLAVEMTRKRALRRKWAAAISS